MPRGTLWLIERNKIRASVNRTPVIRADAREPYPKDAVRIGLQDVMLISVESANWQGIRKRITCERHARIPSGRRISHSPRSGVLPHGTPTCTCFGVAPGHDLGVDGERCAAGTDDF